MNKSASSVKKCCTREFTEDFRWILYHDMLTWGAKCLAFAIIDSPTTTDPKNGVLARRLKSSRQQISVWRKEHKRAGLIFRPEKS